MTSKKFNTRIINKHGSYADWAKATNFIPLKGEIIIYDGGENSKSRVKIGDGSTNVNELPFVSNDIQSIADIEGLQSALDEKASSSDVSTIHTLVGDKSVASQIDDAVLDAKSYTDSKLDAIITTTGDGTHYKANVQSITELKVGASFIMIPHVSSSSDTPYLTVNNFSEKQIKRRLSNISTVTQAGYNNAWLTANTPFRVVYDGSCWIVEGQAKPVAADLYGSVPVYNGGTGATTAEKARINLGIQTVNGTTLSENADYAEVGEWADGNPDNEDRIGYFVAIDENEPGATMVKSNSTSDVRGVTVTAPAFSGNCSKNKFNEKNELLNQYDYVAVMGLVSVIDNGRCVVNGRCMPDWDGTAMASSNNLGYRVVSRIDDTHIMIVLEPGSDMTQRIRTDMTTIEDALQNHIDDKNAHKDATQIQFITWENGDENGFVL